MIVKFVSGRSVTARVVRTPIAMANQAHADLRRQFRGPRRSSFGDETRSPPTRRVTAGDAMIKQIAKYQSADKPAAVRPAEPAAVTDFAMPASCFSRK